MLLIVLKLIAAGCLGFAFALMSATVMKKAAGWVNARKSVVNATKNEGKKEKKSLRRSIEKSFEGLSINPASSDAKRFLLRLSGVVFLVTILITGGKILIAILAGILVFFGLPLYFKNQINRQKRLFNNQLIEAIGSIAGAVRSGQSFSQALEYTTASLQPPLSNAFQGVLKQVAMGSSMEIALNELSAAHTNNDLRMIVTSINLARATGGNLGIILTRIADTMRDRNRIDGKVAALTAQGKASGIIMGIIPFVLLFILYIVEPQMMGLLFSTLIGNALLCIAVVMVALGMFFINKIVTIDI
jgi:tight adherence protein B